MNMPHRNAGNIRVLHVHGGAIHCGASEHILNLARALEGSPVEIRLAVLKDGAVRRKAEDLGLPVLLVQRKFRGDPTVVLRLARLMRRERIDIVHTHTLNSNFYGRLAAILARTPAIVTTVHTELPKVIADDYPSKLIQRLILWFNGFMNRYAERLITVSETMRKFLLEWGVRGDKITVIYNGIDTNAIRREKFLILEVNKRLEFSGNCDIIVGNAGRLVPVKNFEMFIRAARLLIDRGCAATFVIIGDGPNRQQLEELTKSIGLEKKLHFLGWRNDFTRALSSADICVVTSRTETTSLVALQAMALGRPVIATNVASLPEVVVDGETGFLVPLDDDSALADAIGRLVESPEMRERLGVAGRRRVEERFDAKRMARETLEVYRQVLSTRGK